MSTVTAELLERERELAAIREALRGAHARSGSVVALEGPPGVGKTRLLAEAAAEAGELGFEVLSAVGGELERGFAYGVARQLFEPALLRASEDDRVGLLDGAARLAAPAIGFGGEYAAAVAGDAEYSMLHGLYWLGANLAARRPLLISVDDAHWSDESSLRYLAYVTRRLADVPAVVLIAARPAEVDRRVLGALVRGPAVRVVRPRPLTAAAVATLVRLRLGDSIADELCHACHAATEGNPFFVIELLRALEEEELPPDSEAARRVEALGAGAVRDAVSIRLARLPSDAQAAANAVAVLGATAPLRHVAALAELDEDQAAAAVDALTAATFLRPGRPIEFVHPVMREAVYARISAGERARRHARAAQILADWGGNADEIAAHLLHADPTGATWVVDALREAAADAVARGAAEAGVTFLQRAVIEPPMPQTRGELLHELGVAELRAGQLAVGSDGQEPRPIAHLREAVARSDDPTARARAARDLADALWAADRFPEAVQTLERAIDEAGETDVELALGLEAQLVAAGWLDRSTWRRVGRRLDGPAPPAGDSPAQRLLLAIFALRRLLEGEPAETVAELAERAIATPRFGEGLTPQAVNYPGIALMYCDRLERADEVFCTAIAAARARVEIRAVTALLCWRAETSRRRGRLEDAETDAREALSIAEDREWSIAMPSTRAVLAETLLDRGDPQDALAVLEVAGAASDYIGWNCLLYARGRCLVAAGDVRAGLDDLIEAGARQRDWGPAAPAMLPWRSSAATAYDLLGNTEQALRLAHEELDLARHFGAPRAVAIAARAAAAIEGGAHGLTLLQEAADALEGSPAVLDLAATLTDLGSALRRSGRRAAARSPLRRALDIAQRVGAGPLIARSHDELLATGARPRRLVLTGADALTPSERRVARMAAEKLTNREIAQALFVSQRTVETHLTHAYQKLDITTRTQLSDALDPG